MRTLGRTWYRYECPTWCVAVAIYGGWLTLLRYHAALPWWLIVLVGAWLIAWHGSLQHETIHSFASVPRPLRVTIASIPLGVFFPYGSFAREHRRHHRATRLTDPRVDPESFYHDPQRWERYPQLARVVLRWNQTLLGRLLLGAAIQIVGALIADLRLVARGDRRPLCDWAVHGALVVALLAWVSIVTAMPWWQYLLLVAYPGASLAMLRTFYEHSWSADVAHRTTVVENRFPFGLLFLNNNYHFVHHAAPTLPWYRIPAVWDQQRELYVQQNAEHYFRGYGGLARRWLIRPVFEPISPGE